MNRTRALTTLSCFSDLVKEGQYNKIEYPLWRHLRSIINDKGYDTFVFTIPWHNTNLPTEGSPVYLRYGDNFSNSIEVGNRGDNSLGDYLVNNFYVEVEPMKLTINSGDFSSLASTGKADAGVYYCTDTAQQVYNTTNDAYSTATPLKADAYAINDTYGIATPLKADAYSTARTTTLDDLYNVYSNNKVKEKEKENNMNNFNFDFGKVNADAVRMSPYGIAIKNRDGKWVSFNASAQEVIDVDCFNFNVSGMLWKMPVAVSAVQVGDVIVHNRKPMYVVAVDNGIWAADIYEGEKKSIMPLTNMFGFNFVTKIVSLMDMSGAFNTGNNAPTAENPFGGNFMQTMLMCQMMGDGGDMSDLFSGDMGKFMMLSMMTGGQNPFAAMFGGNK